jgi:hypothetical protein
VWQEIAIKGIAKHDHLYTRIVAGIETDEIEKWLNTEFETPAEESLKRATGGSHLSPTDWHNLVRFLAGQDIRTPTRLLENLRLANEIAPAMLNNIVQEAVCKLEAAKQSGDAIDMAKTAYSEYIPLRVTTEVEPGQEYGTLKAETIVGRGYWLFSMKVLANTAKVLQNHKWTILKPPDDLTWFTSDDPVVRLNYYGNGTYDFKGGWGNPGTEIFLTLDPHHLLYTKVGERPPRRDSVVPRNAAEMIRRFIAEHAHRFIFAASADAEVPRLRPRTVNAALLRDERQQWDRWHEDQTIAERKLIDSNGTNPSASTNLGE